MTIERLPLLYRAELLTEIYAHLAAGKCGALIGVASSGKSRLVEFLGRPDVREKYLGPTWTQTLFPWVDGNDLLRFSAAHPNEEWGLYEKILAAILADLSQLPEQYNTLYAKVDEWYWKLTRPENHHLARRFVARAIADLTAAGIRRVVLLLDDLEEFFARAEEPVFSGLRSLRDNFKKDNQYQVLYLLASRKQPTALRETDSPAFESFLELFKNFTHPIGCYSAQDAAYMLERLAKAFPLEQTAVTLEVKRRLYEVTGGHAGLMDAAFHSETEAYWQQPGLAELLIKAGGVWNECTSIWYGLEDEDRSALYAVACGQDPGPSATRWLEKSGLLSRDPSGVAHAFPLLRLFLAEQTKHGQEIKLDIGQHTLTVGNITVTNLSKLEFTLVSWLYAHRGKLCSYLELLAEMQKLSVNQFLVGNPQAEIVPIMQRVQAKIKKAGIIQPIIVHHADNGYQMLATAEGR